MHIKERYNVVIIGCGEIARTGHLPAILDHPRFRLVGLCDLASESIDRLRSACQRHPQGKLLSLKTSQDYRDLLPETDCCIVALHPEHSVDIVIELLRRGLPTLDEKPLARSLEDGQRLVKAVEETGTVYQIGFVMRYCDLIHTAVSKSVSLGHPRFYQVSIYDERFDENDQAHYSKFQQILKRSSAINHEGSHVIDWMSLFTSSSIRAVKASAIATRSPFAGPNLWACNFDYTDGSALQLTLGWLLTDQPPSTLRVVGPAGFLDLDLFRGQGRLALGGQVTEFATQPLSQAWDKQLDAFLLGMESGKAGSATVYDGFRALEATVACEISHQKNSAVYV